MKTAVDWFNQQLVDKQNGNGDNRSWEEIFEQAKEMFEQQIIDAHLKGQREDIDFINEAKQEAEQYYNETFKSE
jgi:hypothetical protein